MNLEESHSHATRALQLDTTSAPGWNIRGMALIDLTDRNAARATELLKRALERGADSVVVIPYLATALLRRIRPASFPSER